MCLNKLKDFHQFFTAISSLYNFLSEADILDSKTLQFEKESFVPADVKSVVTEALNPLKRITRKSRTHLQRKTLLESDLINPKRTKIKLTKKESPVTTNKKPVRKRSKKDALLKRQQNIQKNLENDRIVRENIDMNCPICQQQLDSFTDAHIHFQSLHNRNAYFVCCEKKLSYRKNALDHINWHLNPDNYKCNECGKSYTSMKFLQNHFKNVHETNKQFQCDLCVMQTATIQQLRNHMTSHTFSGPPEFECSFCYKKYVSEDKLKLHKKSNHSLNKYMCEFCSHETKHKCTLEMHIKSAHELPNVLDRIKCDLCGHWLKDARSFRKHLRRHKDSLKEHLCPHCSKKFPYGDSLKNHVRYVHETPKTILCRYCPKSFARPRDHKEHEATHTGENLHTCPFCPQAL